MKKLYLDIETTDIKHGKRRDPSPFLADNRIVSFGYSTSGFDRDSSGYHFIYHSEFNGNPREATELLQRLLDETDILVAFNAKFELEWLYEAGFSYNGRVIDPMVTEYILARGVHVDLDLASCCARRGTIGKLGGLVEEYWSKGLSFYQIPARVVETYGSRDVDCLRQLEECHVLLLQLEENKGLIPTIQMSWDFIKCLVEMERNGINVSAQALCEVKETFTKEYQSLRKELEETARSVMGDTPINLDSPEQLSWLIYSRKVNDKKEWANVFNIGTDARGKRRKPPRMSTKEFACAIKKGTTVIKRTSASHCQRCRGTGRLLDNVTKSGRPFKNPPRCTDCESGILYEDTGRVAGFKLLPRSAHDTAAGGFATDKDTLRELASTIRAGVDNSGLQLAAKDFLEKFVRYNAIGTYLETFVKGIEEGRRGNGILHTQLMQCITRTGRLSSQRPNFQNMPRAGTFPVRRVVRSRWPEGQILEVDFAQLEFRIAAYLAQDQQAIKDIFDKVDAHAYTASIIGCSRQDAKPHTFKPLYGGSSGTEAEQRYYKAFKEKYVGVTKWQSDNISNVLAKNPLVLPSGREYIFPGTRRTPSGYIVNTTQICNYPVQGFATADVVPVAIIEVQNALHIKGLRSIIILTVHDSIVIDVHPDELSVVIDLINECFVNLPIALNRRYGISLNVPLGWEIKAGSDWLNMKKVYECVLPELPK